MAVRRSAVAGGVSRTMPSGVEILERAHLFFPVQVDVAADPKFSAAAKLL